MRKRIQIGEQFQKLDALRRSPASESNRTETRLDEQKGPQAPSIELAAELPQAAPCSLNSEQSLSVPNTVTSEQVSIQTVSSLESVPIRQSPQGDRSDFETVQVGDGERRTVSGLATVQDEDCSDRIEQPVERRGYFTRVPHGLLRVDCQFRDPLDFMVYMHLFTYSHGFDRRDASMSQAQLERFTGSAKNTIKRSLDRLVQDGWIKLIEEYEHARMSRKWRVFTPEDRGGPTGKKRASVTDTVSNGQGSMQTASGSILDTPTLSRIDPYIERVPKEKSKNSHSTSSKKIEYSSSRSERVLPESLRDYFSNLKPLRKQQSEVTFFRELCLDYSTLDLSDSLEWLRENGLPGSGEPCHSPMAFLASGGIGQVMQALSDCKRSKAFQQARLRQADLEQQLKISEEARVEAEAVAREQAFMQAFPNTEDQARMFAIAAADFPALSKNSLILKSLAISRWWDQSQNCAS